MPRYLDLQSWNRREHFHFFKTYAQPFFNICAEVEIGPLLQHCKARQLSFFIASLFLSTKTANAIEPFRYRLRGEQVLVHDRVDAGSAVLNHDETFSFCYFDFTPDFLRFHQNAERRLKELAQGAGRFETRAGRDDLLYYSVIPWVSFTSFTHAQKSFADSSVPKIVFGKYHDVGGKIMMPVSVEVHHALLDGLHVGKFFERLQQMLLQPAASL